MTESQGMYGAHAEYYDRIYHWKDYSAEAASIRDRLAAEGIDAGATLLEAGCGTGSHLVHLVRWYRAAGYDASASMVAFARRKVPEAELFEADMASFRSTRRFDALLSLFGAIAYLHPGERLQAAAAGFADAVRPGGVLLVEPFVAPEKFTAGRIQLITYDGADLKLCRMSTSRVRGEIVELIFHWLALRSDGQSEHFTETHELWLAPTELLVRTFIEAGFEARFDPNGLMPDRGLIVGRRR